MNPRGLVVFATGVVAVLLPAMPGSQSAKGSWARRDSYTVSSPPVCKLGLRRALHALAIFSMVFACLIFSGCGAYSTAFVPGPGFGQPSGTGAPPVQSTSTTFITISNMTTARSGHAATLLLDGRVLITGGCGKNCPSAELYDPSTGKFAPTGSMTTSRTFHTAILLASGKVLLMGGAQDLSAEIYDPSTGTFTPTGNMISGRAVPATLLQDGRVLVGNVNAEIYDPASGTFALTVAYVDANPTWFTATLLQDGRVLLTGCAKACSVGATELCGIL